MLADKEARQLVAARMLTRRLMKPAALDEWSALRDRAHFAAVGMLTTPTSRDAVQMESWWESTSSAKLIKSSQNFNSPSQTFVHFSLTSTF